MKILYLSMSFDLEASNLYNDLVNELLEKKHDVTVVVSKYDIKETKLLNISNQFRIIQIKTGNPFERNILKKGMNQLLIGNKMIKAIKEHCHSFKFDLILYATPPITFSKAIKYCKKVYRAKTFLMLKDIFPQNAIDLEMFTKTNPIYWYFRHNEKELYEISDHIGCMSKGNIKYILEHNNQLDKKKIDLFYNSIKIKEILNPNQINKVETNFIFGGNLGKPQNIKNLLNIIDKLKDYKLAKFTIIGKGTEKHLIEEYVMDKQPSNLIYYDFIPRDEYEKRLLNADVGIISLDPRFTIPNIPSKLPTYMNYKKPVIAITDVNTDLSEIIKEARCGWWFNAADIDSVVEGIKNICSNKEFQKEKGENGYKYLIKNFDVKKNVEQIEKFMED